MSDYQHPNLKAQFGLEKDPNAVEHITSSAGHKLTRTVTAGGHAVDSSQPGFPIYHRRIANPFPLFAIAVGASLLILGFCLVEVRGITNPTIFYTVGLPLGTVGCFTASMFSFAEGSTFLATTAGSLAGLIGGLSLQFLPWTGIQASYVQAAEGNVQAGTLLWYKALGVFFFAAMVPILLLFLASMRTSIPVSSAAFFIVIALILEGAQLLEYPRLPLQKASGAFCILVGILLWYSALAVMLAEEGLKILPVFPLPRVD